MNDPRGSTWRKWDLQVQTYLDPRWTWPADYPGTDEERRARFGDDLIDHCVAGQIEVIAITDHNTGEAIDGLIEKNKERGGPITILPGVEIISSEGIHLIMIFDPSVTENRWDTWAETVRQFLTVIDMPQPAFQGPQNNTPATARKAAEEIFAQARKFKGIVLFAHATSDRGLFHRSDSRTRKRLLKLGNILDAAAAPNDVEARITELRTELSNHERDPFEYAVINTSDSRKIADVGSRFTWIKADPTFNGLEQIIYEPQDRVSIRQNNPFTESQKIFLGKVDLSGSKNFIIPKVDLPLNRELVTIIGGRGSGKSVLLESIAFLNEAHLKEDQNGKKKVIEFYRQNLENRTPSPTFNLATTLVDKDNSEESHEKRLEESDDLGLPFLYIGQEQLSALATNDAELTIRICELLSIDITEIRHSTLTEIARDLLTKLETLEVEIEDLLSRYPDYKGDDFLKWIDKYIHQREEQRKKLSSKTTRDTLEEISKAIDRGIKLKEYKSSLEALLNELKSVSVNRQIAAANREDRKLHGDKAKEIPLIDLTAQEGAISARIRDVETEIEELRKLFLEKKKALASSGLKEDVSVLTSAAEAVQREINNAARDKESYKQRLGTQKNLIGTRNNLYEAVQKHLESAKLQIDDGFRNFLKSREGSREDEQRLFKSIVEGVGVEGEIVLNQDAFCSHVLEYCVDRRSVKTIEEVKALVAKKNTKGQAQDITLESLRKWVENDLNSFLSSSALNVRGAANLIDYIFTQWSSFITVRAVVKLKNVPIEKLSVGQRGTLLLKIYLSTASVKQIFIVDQPEDNLDNQFIMNELVPLVRQLKRARQIILSTHNANLVVNADSEQVIVAKLDGDSNDYIGGGIENPLINQSIKDVLEGGEEAFRNRGRKYGMRQPLT